MMRRNCLLAIVILLAFVVPVFVGSATEAAAPAPAAKAAKEFQIALILKSLSNPAIWNIADAAEKQAAKMGVRVTVLSSMGFSALNDQIKQVEDMIQRRVDLIGLQPVDSKGVIPVIQEANKAGIPVITVDTGADGGKVVTYIATDNFAAGKQAGEWIARQIDGKGKVAMIEGTPGSMQGRQRMEGFHQYIKAQKGINLAVSIPGHFERAKGMQVMEDILTAHPDLKAVFCANDEMALGALEALKQRNLVGKVTLLGMNGSWDALDATAKGLMQGTVVQYSRLHGTEFIRVAVLYLNGTQKTWPEYMPLPTFVADTLMLNRLAEDMEGPMGFKAPKTK
jgi:ribose transport system substrate-binding protein